MTCLNPWIGVLVILGVCLVVVIAFDVVTTKPERDEHEDHSV